MSGGKGSLRSDETNTTQSTRIKPNKITSFMKKILFLSALLTSLFIGVVSCSDDSENIIDDGEEPQWFPTYTIVGKLTYNKDSNCYFFSIDKISDKLVNDTLICNIHNEPEGRIETIRVDTSHVIETNIYELIGSDISVFAGPQSIHKIEMCILC